MKVLNLFVYCTVVAGAIIPPSKPAPSTIVQATRSDNPSAADDSLHSPWPHALVARESSEGQKQAYKAAKQAIGSPSLKAGKHYYFMNCYVAKKGYKPPGPAEEWVLHETQKLKKGFAGCSHVGLVFGKIDKIGTETPGSLSSQKLFYGGEIDLAKWNSNMTAVKEELTTASETWQRGAQGNSEKGKFDESTNCLSYYRDLERLLLQKKV
ncbi:hypothetical protein FDECE_5107 [Fusarium decemcellulare]|nr:hypothetical protein FDECE_5107 [Fusarium decemcellulare]